MEYREKTNQGIIETYRRGRKYGTATTVMTQTYADIDISQQSVTEKETGDRYSQK
jgi:predicted glycoside hydrolase/deacetylase ChbG (UPF0249 family)